MINTQRIQRIFNRPQRSHRRRGAALVEFAVVAPLFLTLVIAIIEFGRALMVQQILTNGSREGARRAIIEGATVTEVENLVQNYLSNATISGATVDVNPATLDTLGFGDPVTVDVSIPYDSITWVPSSWFFADGATLQATAVMRAERVQ